MRRLIEDKQEFSRSLLWNWQRRFFAEKGVEAWSRGEVPHYVTSNPTIAHAYAEIVFAFRRDLDRANAVPDPLHVCELGAGSGRFAFYFLKRLCELCDEADVAPGSFRYVLTDAAESNLDFWRGHPRFRDYFARGVLDLAVFDVLQGDCLALQMRHETIAAGSLRHPLVVIANYVFDSIPQDLFYLKDGGCERCLVSLTADEDAAGSDPGDLLAQVELNYEHAPLTEPPYQDAPLQELLAEYRQRLRDTHLLFPAAGLACLQRLATLSPNGLMVLSADKGEHRLEALDGHDPPALVRHGSVSLSVNYHAFARWCERAGGRALVPADVHRSIVVMCLLMLAEPARFAETRRAYRRHVEEFGPDAFFTITRHARATIKEMSAEHVLAYLRLARYDSHQFGRYLPRLVELAADLNPEMRREVTAAIDKVWASYFPLGEDLDLANHIAGLLYALDDFTGALDYFERSIEIYGRDTGTLFNMAACHHLLGRDEEAAGLLRTVVAEDPRNGEAAALLARISQPAGGGAEGGAADGGARC